MEGGKKFLSGKAHMFVYSAIFMDDEGTNKEKEAKSIELQPKFESFIWIITTIALTVFIYWEEYTTTGFETWVGSTPMWSIICTLPFFLPMVAIVSLFLLSIIQTILARILFGPDGKK